jgi:deoxyribodipyrimidine photo-lyase
MWFRRDLRVQDHPAFAEAAAFGEVLALFVVDPSFAGAGLPRRNMLAACLEALDDALGGSLVVRIGDPRVVVPAAAREVGAHVVFVSKDFSPYGRVRDAAVAEELRADGRQLRGVGTPYVVPPGTVRKGDGTPYAVFTPFSRSWRAAGWAAPIEAPGEVRLIDAPTDTTRALRSLRTAGSTVDGVTASERAAHERWDQFRGSALDDYRTGRDLPSIDGTSRLSPQLKFGVVHPRQLLADLSVGEPGHDTFASELAWRDFYADVLFHRPESAWQHLDTRFDSIRYDTGPGAEAKFERWCSGTTGFPIVDAGMRQLVRIGWMHNRVRMITASFLVKDLHLPWTWGARFFLDHLLDGDLASNNHGWQWAAGSGTDAAPYFRVFNPTSQQERWDPDGEYVDHWIPELGTSAYSAPMVDHAAERLEALARYEGVKRHSRSR